jgi:DNA-binding transcriptional ArsR family regulator
MDEIFRALGDPTRLRIVGMLARHGEVCVCKIVDELDMNQPAVSFHMSKLKQAGLLNSRKEGQWIHYSLKADAIASGPLAFLSEIVSLAEASPVAVRGASCCEGGVS